jgi:hypothetical protein
MLSEIFWTAFLTIGSGMVIKLASMAYKSKCKECSFLGFRVIRDTEAEERETEFRILHKQPSNLDEEEAK